MEMPECVPPLIAALYEAIRTAERASDKRVSERSNIISNTANTSTNAVTTRSATAAANMAVNAALAAVNAAVAAAESQLREPDADSIVLALAKQRDRRAVVPLRQLLTRTESNYGRSRIVMALLKCGSYTPAEQVDAMVAWRKAYNENSVTNANGPVSDSDADEIPEQIILGSQVAGLSDPSDDLVRETAERISRFAKSDPPAAEFLRGVMVNWNGLAVDALLLQYLKEGNTDLPAVLRLVSNRKQLREKLSSEIFALNQGSATAAGIGVCLLEDPSVMHALLTSDSIEAATAAIACGRLIRTEIPTNVLVPLYGKAARLDKAIDLYLESRDTPETRAVIYSRHGSDLPIIGAAQSYFADGNEDDNVFARKAVLWDRLYQSVFGTTEGNGLSLIYDRRDTVLEDKWRDNVKADASILGVYVFGEHAVVIHQDKVVYIKQTDPSRFFERQLRPEEFEQLKDILTRNDVDNIKSSSDCPEDCDTTQLIMLGRSGGRRISVWSDKMPKFFRELQELFTEFETERTKLRYELEKQISGLTVIHSDDQRPAITVWSEGGVKSVLITDISVRKQVADELRKLYEKGMDDEVDDSAAFWQDLRKQREQRTYEGFQWFAFDGELRGPVAQPSGSSYMDAVSYDLESWKRRAAGIMVVNDDEQLFKVAAGRRTLLSKLDLSSSVISADGRFALAGGYDAEYNYQIFRFDLAANQAFKVLRDGSTPVGVWPIAFVPETGKFLAGTQRGSYDYHDHEEEDDTPDTHVPYLSASDKMYWIDPQTGRVELAAGEVRPLRQQTFRRLQPTGKPDEYWAAIPEHPKNKTAVGRYNARTAKFTVEREFSRIIFDSMRMHVDEAGGKVYLTYNGHLLSVPLKDG